MRAPFSSRSLHSLYPESLWYWQAREVGTVVAENLQVGLQWVATKCDAGEEEM